MERVARQDDLRIYVEEERVITGTLFLKDNRKPPVQQKQTLTPVGNDKISLILLVSIDHFSSLDPKRRLLRMVFVFSCYSACSL